MPVTRSDSIHLPAHELGAVNLSSSSTSSSGLEGHEAKAARPAGLAIGGNEGVLNGAILAEETAQVISAGVPRQVTWKK